MKWGQLPQLWTLINVLDDGSLQCADRLLEFSVLLGRGAILKLETCQLWRERKDGADPGILDSNVAEAQVLERRRALKLSGDYVAQCPVCQ